MNPTTKGERWRWHPDDGCIEDAQIATETIGTVQAPTRADRNRRGHLAAAAPEMFEALEGALDSLEYLRDCCPDFHVGAAVRAERIGRARAALSRAKGERP